MLNLKEFEDIYARYLSSGLRVKEFCRNDCINTSKFFYWQHKLRKQQLEFGKSPGFVPIIFTGNNPQPRNKILSPQPVVPQTPTTENVYEIIYPGGVMLRVPPGTPLGQLQSLILLTKQDHV